MSNTSTQPTDSRRPAIAEHAREYAETGGEKGHHWKGATTLLLTTTGRTTGLARRTVLVYSKYGPNYVIVASDLGSDRQPDWYLNLVRTPLVTIQVGAETLTTHARILDGRERHVRWQIMAELWPEYDTYQARTYRIIPVIELEPTGPAVPAPTSEGSARSARI